MLDTDFKDPIISAMTPCAFLDYLFSRLQRRGIVDRSTSQGRSVLDLGKGFFSASCRRGRSTGQSINVSHHHKSIEVPNTSPEPFYDEPEDTTDSFEEDPNIEYEEGRSNI